MARHNCQEKFVTSDHTSTVRQQLQFAMRIILPCTVLLVILDQLPFLTDSLDRGQTIGRDAFNFWMAGKLALEGNIYSIYDNVSFMHAVKNILGPEAGQHVFPYPPIYLLFVAAFGWLPYLLTLLIWSLIGLIAFIFVTVTPSRNRKLLLLSLIAPLSLANLILGQNGLFSAALFIGGLRLAYSRPVLAGILIGCLSYKPMLAVLLPIALLMERRWLVIICASITMAVLCILPAIFWGTEIWHDYINKAIPFQKLLLEYETGLAQPMKLTSFIAMRIIGFDLATAYKVQIGFSLAALSLLLIYCQRRKCRGEFNALDITVFAVTTMAILPYAHFYDMTLIAGGLILMSHQNKKINDKPFIFPSIFGLLWALPVLGLLGNMINLPIAPIVLFLGLILLCLKTTFRSSKKHKSLLSV